uniref:Uncharacterized protein n=1 Tax=viral metagenome TaxID=1070528 RepID=A0A6M3XKP5_9ZZZZ
MADIALTTKTVTAQATLKQFQNAASIVDTMFLDEKTVFQTERHEFTLNSTTTLGEVTLNIAPAVTRAGTARWVMAASNKWTHLRYSIAGGATTAIGTQIAPGGMYLAAVSTSLNTLYIKNLDAASTATVTVIVHLVSWT